MNRNRRLIVVPPDLVSRGLKHGQDMADGYAKGLWPNSLAVSGGRGTENNPKRLGEGKIGEIALGLLFGAEPSWEMRPDAGSDVKAPCGLLVDCKTTYPPRRLIWSRTVNDLYFKKKFDALVAVSIKEDDYSQCWVEGWMPRREFFARKTVSDGSCGLEPDTWWMSKDDLHDINLLLTPSRPKPTAWMLKVSTVDMRALARQAIAEKKQFEFISGQWP